MELRKLNGAPHGAVRIEDEPALRLADGSIVTAYEETAEDCTRYECVVRPDGRIQWYELVA